jgi:hypothetical protein
MLTNFSFLGLLGIPAFIVWCVLFVVLGFEIAMFISAVTNKHISGNAKVLWIIGMLLVHPFVAIAYYFTDYKKAK